MRLRHVAVVAVSALVVLAGAEASAQGALSTPTASPPGVCHGLKGQQRAQCQRRLADVRKCQRLHKAANPFCTVVRLAGDETQGRDNDTPGSAG